MTTRHDPAFPLAYPTGPRGLTKLEYAAIQIAVANVGELTCEQVVDHANALFDALEKEEEG